MEDVPMTLAGALADRDGWVADDCSIAGTLRVVGTRSAMLLMREAHYGTTRFEDFVRRVGVTEAVAAARLRELVDAGLLTRRPYRKPGQRTRHEYALTRAGVELRTVLLALMQWGDRHLPRPDGPPLGLRHTGCGSPVTVEVRCEEGHTVDPGDVTVQATRRRRSRPARPAETQEPGRSRR